MSPAEYWAALDAHSHEIQAGRMHTGELARGLGVRIFNLLVGKEHRIRRVQEFWQMPWDDKSSGHEQAELERLNALKGDDLIKEIELFNKRINNGSR